MTDTLQVRAWQLAQAVGCSSYFDGPDSAGARFFASIVDDVDRAPSEREYSEREDWPSEIAESVTPIYTGEVWATFVDIAAYNTEESEEAADGRDMSEPTAWAIATLWLIASNAAAIELGNVQDDDDTDGADNE